MEDNRPETLYGKKISELNNAEARGWIINRMNQLELTLNSKISDFFEPKDKNKFKEIILNSSVINIGGKLKVLSSCGLLNKATIEHIRKLNSIRNGFAHAVFVPTTELMIDRENKKTEAKSSYHTLKMMNSQGKIKSKKVHKHLERFYEIYRKVHKAL